MYQKCILVLFTALSNLLTTVTAVNLACGISSFKSNAQSKLLLIQIFFKKVKHDA